MTNLIPVIDLFSGPGGLSEGFSPCNMPISQRRYKVVLSVEKEQYAYDTLLLRAFLRQFNNGLPLEYYQFLNSSTPEPDWQCLYPNEWQAACKETKMLELGDPIANSLLEQEINSIREKYGKRVILVGGPPCQAYSIAGRARIAGIEDYTPDDDPRIHLYEQYVKIVSMLEPAIAVMENVKGMISSSINEEDIFQKIMRSLRSACGADSYQLFAFSPSTNDLSFDDLLKSPSEFIVRAEEYGIPQTRHRVFIACIQSEIAQRLSVEYAPRLAVQNYRNSVESVIGAMPKLRSGLSRSDDLEAWRKAIIKACDKVERYMPNMEHLKQKKFLAALKLARESAQEASLTRTTSGGASPPEFCSKYLQSWLYDDKLEKYPNHETRGHMPSDLERYLFATAFAKTFGRSPKTDDFPSKLASNHKSWTSNKFADRFRVQLAELPAKTITSHIAKDGHYFIHPDPSQCRSLTVREAARLQTFPDNYLFKGNRTTQYVQVGNAVPPLLAHQIANCLWKILEHCDQESLIQTQRNSSEMIKSEVVCRAVAL